MGESGATGGMSCSLAALKYGAILIAAVAMLGMHSARAETDAGALRDVENLFLEIAPLDEDSGLCGITRNRIAQSVRREVAETPLKLDGVRHILLIRVSSLPKDGECFSSIDLGAYYKGKLALPDRPDGQGKVVLWENGTIVISPRSQHWTEVENILQHLMRGFVADWRGDNAGSG